MVKLHLLIVATLFLDQNSDGRSESFGGLDYIGVRPPLLARKVSEYSVSSASEQDLCLIGKLWFFYVTIHEILFF